MPSYTMLTFISGTCVTCVISVLVNHCYTGGRAWIYNELEIELFPVSSESKFDIGSNCMRRIERYVTIRPTKNTVTKFFIYWHIVHSNNLMHRTSISSSASISALVSCSLN